MTPEALIAKLRASTCTERAAERRADPVARTADDMHEDEDA
jgi:hypothetical protein